MYNPVTVLLDWMKGSKPDHPVIVLPSTSGKMLVMDGFSSSVYPLVSGVISSGALYAGPYASRHIFASGHIGGW